MYKKGKMIGAIMMIGFLILLSPAFVTANDKTINVRCDKGESVQDELDKLTGPATITVTGTCHVNLVIKNDDVSLQGGTYEPSDPTKATIFVQGARRIAITSVTVWGGSYGVLTERGSLTLENSLIKETTSRGVVSVFGSSVTVNSSKIQDNKQIGVFVNDNSALVLTNCFITGNYGPGVLVQRASSARIGVSIAGVAGPNEITNNRSYGIGVLGSAYAMIDGNKITGNSGNGVYIEGAYATVINNTIANNKKGIAVINSGSARIGLTEGGQPGPNTIENNSLDGIHCASSGAAYIYSNTIRNNGLTTNRHGVGIYRATAELLGNNTIQGNGGHGVSVNQGALYESVGDFIFTPAPNPDLITENVYSGIYAWNAASLDVQNATVTNNTQNGIVLSLRSTLRIYKAIVSGNQLDGIRLYDGSSVARYTTNNPPASITNNLGWGIACYGGSNLIGGTGDLGVWDNLLGQINCPPIIIPSPLVE